MLIKPDPERRIGWRARFRDPDSNDYVKVSLPAERTTDEARRDWAASKSRELAKRRLALAEGAPRATGLSLKDALARFKPPLKRDPRPGTLDLYRRVANKLLVWAEAHGIVSAEDLTRAKLVEFRMAVMHETRRVHSKGTPRKHVTDSGLPRSAHTINSDLRKLRTILECICDLDLLPRLNNNDLRRTLKKVETTTERHEFLRPAEIEQLLKACLLHDAETFVETREEHAGEGRRRIGTTLRYEPIAPFVAHVLLTGCRYGEATGLLWKQVDLDVTDHEGRVVGEIRLKGASTKTRKAREIDLSVSPALRSLLQTIADFEGRVGSVFGLSRATADAAAKRLRADYGAPQSFTWQALRRTCGTFLTNAPGIFGGASVYRSARQLGHTVQIAERHYLGTFRGIPREARTLEAAMRIEDVLARVEARVRDTDCAARAAE